MCVCVCVCVCVCKIPNRHNYILWLKSLLDSTSAETRRPTTGLDIGTGASCIYPLLACSQRSAWSLLATDIDPTNHASASHNLALNPLLAQRISLLPLRQSDDSLIPEDCPALDFCMTNPPFFASADEMLAGAAAKSRPPLSACTGAAVEMVTPGGEVSFISRLIDESLTLQHKITWYTTMLGKHSSLEALIRKLKDAKVGNYAVAELVQGRATRRWVLGWSFGAARPAQSVARGVKASSLKGMATKDLLPAVTEADVVAVPEWDEQGRPGVGAEELGKRIGEAVGALELSQWQWDSKQMCGHGTSLGSVWTRSWRRQNARGDANDSFVEPFGFQVEVHQSESDSRIWCRWLNGHDPVQFESFRGWLARKVHEHGFVKCQIDDM